MPLRFERLRNTYPTVPNALVPSLSVSGDWLQLSAPGNVDRLPELFERAYGWARSRLARRVPNAGVMFFQNVEHGARFQGGQRERHRRQTTEHGHCEKSTAHIGVVQKRRFEA